MLQRISSVRRKTGYEFSESPIIQTFINIKNFQRKHFSMFLIFLSLCFFILLFCYTIGKVSCFAPHGLLQKTAIHRHGTGLGNRPHARGGWRTIVGLFEPSSLRINCKATFCTARCQKIVYMDEFSEKLPDTGTESKTAVSWNDDACNNDNK